MNLQDGLILMPQPCIFCGGVHLEIRCVVLRHWNVYCRECYCKGPDAVTPDEAVFKWNGINEDSYQSRTQIGDEEQQMMNPSTVSKIWKTCRMQRTFTINDLERLTRLNRNTIYKYVRLLKINEYVREEGTKSEPGAPKIYRCICPEVIVAPTWAELQMQEYEREEKQYHLKKQTTIKVRAEKRELEPQS